jgi:hypothetical protein
MELVAAHKALSGGQLTALIIVAIVGFAVTAAYFFDDWRSPKRHLWQAHEADWESVSFGLRADFSLLYAAYSEHCSGTVAPSSMVKFEDGHPVVYAALGSHANYLDLHSHPTYPLECRIHYTDATHAGQIMRLIKTAKETHLLDQLGTKRSFGPAQTGHPPLTLVDLDGPLPDWARFAGRWSGEGQYIWLFRTPTRLTRKAFGDGPTTPNFNAISVESFWHTGSG